MWKFPMEKLTLNEQKVWRILRDFPSGMNRKNLMKLSNLPSSTLYEILNSLEVKGYVENKKRKWIPKTEEKRSAETFLLPNPNLTAKERRLYRLDVDYLNIIKGIGKEWFQEEWDKFKLKYGVTQKKGSLEP